MKIYKDNNVFDEAIKRIHRLFDEFPNIVIGYSGGKDSTVILGLTLMVARERNRLPIPVIFIDQEAEWEHTIEQVREVMNRDRVKPYWLQCPIRLFNATSTAKGKSWLHCWKEGEEWMRKKEDISIKENRFNEDRFKAMFKAVVGTEFPDTKTAFLGGVRTEESPGRMAGLTNEITYKDITWGNQLDKKKGHYSFYPIYDWTYQDIWKAINDNSWNYNKIYDLMFKHGVPIQEMRVSNLHHETAVKSLYFIQKLEPETWNKLNDRVEGTHMAGQLKNDAFQVPKKLPYVFKSWKEYRDYLLENLIKEEDKRGMFRNEFKKLDKKYELMRNKYNLYKAEITCILSNDYYFTKLVNFERRPEIYTFRKWKKGEINQHSYNNKYIPKK